MTTSSPSQPDIRSLLENGFDEAAARSLYAQGEAVVVFALMQLAALALKTQDINGTHPSTPSATVPAYQKEPGKKRKKKPGAKPGHKGSRRPPPIINRHEERRQIADGRRQQTQANIMHLSAAVCKLPSAVSVVPDAMPNASIGNRTVVLTAFLHYFIGITISKIIEVFNTQFQFPLTPGGLVDIWHRLALVLMLWYEEIGEVARTSAVLHADETGWRVNGKTYWLWCFTAQDVTYYVIDRSRASPVVLRFFKKAFAGVLVSDFWGAYNAIVCAQKQRCLAHLLGDMKKVAKYKDTSGDWKEFAKRLKRLLRDAMRLRARRNSMTAEKYESLCKRIEDRMTALIAESWKNGQAQRLVKRLRRHRAELLVFLYKDGVPSDNNQAERTIRNAVVMRKNSYCNRSEDGAKTQAILMSVFQTLKQRGYQGTDIVIDALRQYITTKKLPALPKTLQTAE